MSLSSLFDPNDAAGFVMNRNSLKDQTTELLREQILNGQIPPGTKLVEREVANLLGISRMPARDALMDLEREGLIVTKQNGRYVIEPTQADLEHLYQVRFVLEGLAVELAATRATPEFCRALRSNLEEMRAAIVNNDRAAYVRSDLEAHQLIWEQSGNPHLQKMLHSITGPIFLFVASHTEFQADWNETLQFHIELTDVICAGDPERAVQSMQSQLDNSLHLSLRIFQNQSTPPSSSPR